MHLRIGTRGSRLARAQTGIVCERLQREGVETETVVIRTEGDEVTSVPLHEIGGQGLFVRALDEAILEGRIDAAVHSMKDIPARRPMGVSTCAVLERDSPADFMAFRQEKEEIRVVGTSSMRRRAQLLHHHPGLEVHPLRGNIDTRIRKLQEGRFDAIVIAEAGIRRLGYLLEGERLDPRRFVPTPNQGVIAVVCREDAGLTELLSLLDHAPTHRDAMLERAVMEEMGAGCFTPLGIYCERGHLIAEVYTPDGRRAERVEETLTCEEEARECGRDFRYAAADIMKEAQACQRRSV